MQKAKRDKFDEMSELRRDYENGPEGETMNDALNRFIGYVIGLITMYLIMRITEAD